MIWGGDPPHIYTKYYTCEIITILEDNYMKIITVLFLISLVFSIDEQDDIGFLYGVLGHLNFQNDTTTVLQDTSVIHTGDEVRINVGYQKETHFYVIFNDSEGEFDLLYPGNNKMIDNMVDLPDTIYTTVLHWTQFSDPAGYETFFLINSNNEQEHLLDLFMHYEKVNDKGRKKVAKKIQQEIEKIDPENKRNLKSVGSRLDKPIMGGITYRADDEDEVMDISLTHYCRGSSGIAFKKILLDHK